MSRPDAQLEAEVLRTIDGLNAGDESRYVKGWRLIKLWLADGDPEVGAQERMDRMAVLLKSLHAMTWAKIPKLKSRWEGN